MEEIEKELNRIKNEIGSPCRRNIINEARKKFISEKSSLKWTIRTIKRLEKLIKKNPSVIYIYDHTDLEACNAEGQSANWIDVHIALPFLFGLHSIWVCTLMTKECFKSDREFAIEHGGEIFNLEDQFRSDQFNDFYLDIDGFKTEQDIIDSFRVWARIFIPELAEKEIKFELKENKVRI